MEITPVNIRESRSRSRSRSRTRNSTANSRSTSSTRRPSLGSKKSLSSSSINKITIIPTQIDNERSIPSVQVFLDNTLPTEFFKQDILALTKTLKISKWHKKQLNIQNLIINRISGALTNSIYKIEYHDSAQNLYLPALLLRVYGRNVDELIDRDNELQILVKLSQKRIGPRLLGIFTNGRFEQFLDGFTTLNKSQIRDEIISQMLGRRMKDLHYKIELDAKDYEKLPTCWYLIEKWLKIIENEYLPGYVQAKIDPKTIFFMNFQDYKSLIFKYKDWLFDKYDELEFSLNYKFCHNDTQYGNLLLHESFKPEDIIVNQGDSDEVNIKSTSNKKDSNLVVIDFEYSGPNFPAFDIVNHFSEWMADYHDPIKSYYINEEKYPTKLQQLNLIKSYIEYDFQYPSSNLKTNKKPQEILNDTSSASRLIQSEIEKLYNECIYWRPSVQIFWSLWGLIQNGPIKSTTEIENGTMEQGIDSTYNITTALDSIHLEDIKDLPVIEDGEAITSSDDDFDYIKYSNQKIALILGDLIQFRLFDKEYINVLDRDLIKYLNTDLFEI
ncbi:unnamed protein product [Candida verbasci]|uniref:Choline kinase N-terminal domain-containing protein n=1 Tax=Candida verbasci TaxID=1227364 RepID=A0A9W4TYC3_9ASCO|nr:unnamed protein product [Candida verbasci]